MKLWGYWHRTWSKYHTSESAESWLDSQDFIEGGFTLHLNWGMAGIHLYCCYDYFNIEVNGFDGLTIWEFAT